ncbi:hypothetical protein K440DRAFT_636445 [Wilcoxina mikolae CBS 423.85]|nr:hypothetical protein K440DRAFT_636445 [Wilcoxina mikolae CBS 423.85]
MVLGSTNKPMPVPHRQWPHLSLVDMPPFSSDLPYPELELPASIREHYLYYRSKSPRTLPDTLPELLSYQCDASSGDASTPTKPPNQSPPPLPRRRIRARSKDRRLDPSSPEAIELHYQRMVVEQNMLYDPTRHYRNSHRTINPLALHPRSYEEAWSTAWAHQEAQSVVKQYSGKRRVVDIPHTYAPPQPQQLMGPPKHIPRRGQQQQQQQQKSVAQQQMGPPQSIPRKREQEQLQHQHQKKRLQQQQHPEQSRSLQQQFSVPQQQIRTPQQQQQRQQHQLQHQQNQQFRQHQFNSPQQHCRSPQQQQQQFRSPQQQFRSPQQQFRSAQQQQFRSPQQQFSSPQQQQQFTPAQQKQQYGSPQQQFRSPQQQFSSPQQQQFTPAQQKQQYGSPQQQFRSPHQMNSPSSSNAWFPQIVESANTFSSPNSPRVNGGTQPSLPGGGSGRGGGYPVPPNTPSGHPQLQHSNIPASGPRELSPKKMHSSSSSNAWSPRNVGSSNGFSSNSPRVHGGTQPSLPGGGSGGYPLPPNTPSGYPQQHSNLPVSGPRSLSPMQMHLSGQPEQMEIGPPPPKRARRSPVKDNEWEEQRQAWITFGREVDAYYKQYGRDAEPRIRPESGE